MRIDLDLRRVRFFVEVVRQGGFSAAAKVLFATQPTVSKAVQQLEHELGAELLRRVGQRSTLTDAGRLVYEHGMQLLAGGAGLRAELEALKSVRSGRLAIGFPRMGTSALFAAPLATFNERFPGIEVRIGVHGGPELIERLRDGTLEVAAMFSSPADVDFREAVVDQVVALVPASHPLASRSAIAIADLADVPLILFEEDVPAGAQILDEFRRRGVAPLVFARTNQLELLFELAGSGAAVGFVPAALARGREHRSTRAVPLADTTIPWRIGMAWIRGRYLSYAAKAWLQHAGEVRTRNDADPLR